MSGYGRYGKRADVIQRQHNMDETARMVNEGGMTTKEIAAALGLAPLTVTRYRMELIAEGRIERNPRGPRGE